MAIDDNKSYELTGAQVKDLASKINAKADTSSLATVATSGSYTDLTNTPSIPAAQVNSDWNASSGVAQILNKPTIPNGQKLFYFDIDPFSATALTDGISLEDENHSTAYWEDAYNAYVGDGVIFSDGLSAESFYVPTKMEKEYASGEDTTILRVSIVKVLANGKNVNALIRCSDWGTNYAESVLIGRTAIDAAFTGTDGIVAGTAGLVPAPSVGDESKVLSGAGTWVAQSGGGSDSNYFFMLDVSPTTGTAANPTNLRATTGVSTVQYNELVAAITANKNIILVKDLTYHDFYRVEEAFINSDGYVVLNISSFGAVGYYSLNGESEIKIFDPTYDPTNYPNGAALCVYYEANYLTNTAGSVSSTNLASSAVTTSKIANGTVTEAKLDWSTICYSNSPSETNGAFRVIDMTTTRTINAGDNEFSISISSQVPTGFVPIGIIGMDFSGAGYSRIIVTRNYISGNTISCCFYQTYGSSQSITITWKILCIKSAN